MPPRLQVEQLLSLDYHFWQAVALSMAVVFVISLMFGMSWLNASLIACFAVALCVEVATRHKRHTHVAALLSSPALRPRRLQRSRHAQHGAL